MTHGLYVFFLLGALSVAAISQIIRRLPLPPGPKGALLTGVRHLLPSSEPWKVYWSWAEDFAVSIISFRVYNTRFVVLNDANSVTELLVNRAKIYSDRPRHTMYTDICNRKNSVFNISSLDERHRRYRKLLHTGLNPSAVRDYWSSTAIIMRLAYGYPVTENDRFIKVAEESAKISGFAMAPGRWLVNHYPILRVVPSCFPGAGWKRQGLAWGQQLTALSDVPHSWVKDQMATGKFEPSFTSRLLQNNQMRLPEKEYEDLVKWCAGGLYAGATDTTVSALTSFILLMALHSGVQARLHDELDQSFGRDNLPRPADVGKLPYLTAVLKEVLRFAPVANLGLPHKVIEDDEYRGYRIPKNSTVIANIWAIMNDPTLYPEPSTFSPDRFMTSTPLSNASLYDQPQLDPRKFAFGFGRRTCPGINFAETMLLLTMASVLVKFDISLPSGTQPPTVEFTSGITRWDISSEEHGNVLI